MIRIVNNTDRERKEIIQENKSNFEELISVIIPVYNGKNDIPNVLKALTEQTCGRLELVFVDDGSTDGSGELLEKASQTDPRIRVFHKENSGPADARNLGIDKARGTYIAFCDCDDLPEIHMLERLRNNIERTGADIAACRFLHIFPDRPWDYTTADDGSCKVLNREEALRSFFYQKEMSLAGVCAKLYRRTLFDDIRFVSGIHDEDFELQARILRKLGTLVLDPSELYGYRHHAGARTSRETEKERLAECGCIDVTERILSDIGSMSPAEQKAFHAYQITAAFRVLLNSSENEAFRAYREKAESYMKDHAEAVLRDPEVRKKTKGALILYKYFRPLLPAVYKRIDRWKQ